LITGGVNNELNDGSRVSGWNSFGGRWAFEFFNARGVDLKAHNTKMEAAAYSTRIYLFPGRTYEAAFSLKLDAGDSAPFIGTMTNTATWGGGLPLRQCTEGKNRFAFVADGKEKHIAFLAAAKAPVEGFTVRQFTFHPQKISVERFTQHYVGMLTAALNDGIVPIVSLMPPCSKCSNSAMAVLDSYNAALRSLTARFPAMRLVDPQAAMGTKRSGGTPAPPPDNTWDCANGLCYDRVHHSKLGLEIFASLFVEQIQQADNTTGAVSPAPAGFPVAKKRSGRQGRPLRMHTR
jgi:hypothetical protein